MAPDGGPASGTVGGGFSYNRAAMPASPASRAGASAARLPSAADREALLKVGLRLAAGARRIILATLARGLRVSVKPDRSFVTDADRAVERFIRGELRRRFPDHGLVGEEFGSIQPDAPYRWIVDPIDGTLSFLRGIPLYGTILALQHRGRPVLGIIDHPGLGETYSAAAGLGAFLDGRRLRLHDLGPREPIEGEVIATGDRGHFVRLGAERRFDKLMASHPQVRSYADCFGHTLAARGAVGAMADFGVKLWDIAATEVLVTEAGGRYELVSERPSPDGAHYGVVFGKPRVVRWLLPILAGRRHGPGFSRVRA